MSFIVVVCECYVVFATTNLKTLQCDASGMNELDALRCGTGYL